MDAQAGSDGCSYHWVYVATEQLKDFLLYNPPCRFTENTNRNEKQLWK